MIAIIEVLYLIIGLLVMRSYWLKNYEKEYQTLKQSGNADDNMAILTMMGMIILWPVVVVRSFFKND